jgi:Ca2+-binding EF-hand superfamily protein
MRSLLMLMGFKWHLCGGATKGPSQVGMDQFAERMGSLGMDQGAARAVFTLLDVKQRRNIDASEFIHVLIINSGDSRFAKLQDYLLRYIFKLMEGDGGKGQEMTPDRFANRLERLGLDALDCRRAFAIVDEDHGGSMSTDEFIKSMASDGTQAGKGEAWLVKYAILVSGFLLLNGGDARKTQMTPKELQQAMRIFGVSEVNAMKAFSAIDEDSDGSVTISEFCRAMAGENREATQAIKWAVLKAAFQALGNRPLQRHEFVQAVAKFGGKPADCEALFVRMDRNGSGIIDQKLFCHAMVVDGTHAADPRSLMVVKYSLLKLVVRSMDPGCWDSQLAADPFVKRAGRLGVPQDAARKLFSDLAEGKGRASLNMAELMYACVVIVNPDPHASKVREVMFGQLAGLLRVSPGTILTADAFAALCGHAGVTAPQAKVVFQMLDMEHQGVIQWEFFLAAIM